MKSLLTLPVFLFLSLHGVDGGNSEPMSEAMKKRATEAFLPLMDTFNNNKSYVFRGSGVVRILRVKWDTPKINVLIDKLSEKVEIARETMSACIPVYRYAFKNFSKDESSIEPFKNYVNDFQDHCANIRYGINDIIICILSNRELEERFSLNPLIQARDISAPIPCGTT